MLEWNAQQLELSNLEGGPTMPHEEYLVLQDRADGTGDVIEISRHWTAEKAIEVCQQLHAKTGIYYEVEYLLVDGSKDREILEVDGIYGIGEKV